MVHGKRLLGSCTRLHDMRLQVARSDVVHECIRLHGVPGIPQRLQCHHLHNVTPNSQQLAVEASRDSCTKIFALLSATHVLAKSVLKYYRISQCNRIRSHF